MHCPEAIAEWYNIWLLILISMVLIPTWWHREREIIPFDKLNKATYINQLYLVPRFLIENLLIDKFWSTDFDRQILIDRFWSTEFDWQILIDRFWLTYFDRQILIDRFWSTEFDRQNLIDRFWSTDFDRQILIDTETLNNRLLCRPYS